jgi:Zn-finger nucleic acid-binding protein
MRNGVEIDTCGRCRGIWLDRGELDKLVDQEASYRDDGDDDDDDDDDDFGDDRGQRGDGRPRRKRGFFQNLMDNLGDFGGD